MYKYFTIDDNKYCFSSENIEIVRLPANLRGKDVSWQTSTITYSESVIEYITSDSIGINLVSGCNLACEYCYLSAYAKTVQKLNLKQLEDILRFITHSGLLPKTIYFIGGGEPTLNFDLLRQMPELCKINGLGGVHFSLTTNGTTLNDEMISFFKENKFDLSISLDGDNQVTNASRKYRDGRGVFQDVFTNLNLLMENEVPFTCKALLQPKNNIFETFRFFETNQIEFAIDFANDAFDGHYLTDLQDIELLKSKLSSVCDYYVFRDSSKKIHCTSIRSGLSRIHRRIRNRTGCQSVVNGYTIDLDGKIYTCSMGSGNERLKIGDIGNGIDYYDAIRRKCYPETVDKKEACKTCWAKYLCGGGCFALNTIKTGDPNVPDSYRCEVEKAYWEFIITLYIRLHPFVNKNTII